MKKKLLYAFLLSIIYLIVSCNGNANKEIVQFEKAHNTIIKQVVKNDAII